VSDWGKVDDKASIDTLHYAFDKGINFVDTAELYGNGHSETVIGQALKQWKGHKIYVATKARPVVWPAPDDDAPQMRGCFPEWYLRDSIDKSLKRLGVERIDLFQLHSFMPSGMVELDWLETLMKLRSEGKVDRIGPDHAALFETTGHLELPADLISSRHGLAKGASVRV
jgi:aryl-alcohol dehydrogenase-like predicted oxidoreductase